MTAAAVIARVWRAAGRGMLSAVVLFAGQGGASLFAQSQAKSPGLIIVTCQTRSGQASATVHCPDSDPQLCVIFSNACVDMEGKPTWYWISDERQAFPFLREGARLSDSLIRELQNISPLDTSGIEIGALSDSLVQQLKVISDSLMQQLKASGFLIEGAEMEKMMKELDTVSNIRKVRILEIEVYPNPSSTEKVHVRLKEGIEGKLYVLFPDGRMGIERTLREEEKEFSLLLHEKGRYFMIVEGNGGEVIGWQTILRK